LNLQDRVGIIPKLKIGGISRKVYNEIFYFGGNFVKKLIVSTIALSFISISPAFAKYSGGDGSEANPWQISCPNDLLYLGSHTEDYNSCFILTADVNLAGYTFTTAVIAPDIDNLTNGFQGTAFIGTFDGNGFVIRNLTIDTNEAGNDYLGLFGNLKKGSAEVRNLGLENASIKGGNGSNFLGGLCGWSSEASITNCYATGNITGGDDSVYLGGLCGVNGGSITNCYASGSVKGGDGSVYLGGLVGDNYYYGTISNCYSTSSVTGGNHSDYLGGLCGVNGGSITNCYASGSVKGGDGSVYLGGLVGNNGDYGTISNCYATGDVSGHGFIGGLVGDNSWGTISNCYSTGSVTGGARLGGLCGSNWGRVTNMGGITNCHAIGSVTGGSRSNRLGGLVGDNYGAISDCYSTGSVTGGNNSGYLGGLCGENDEDSSITNCYSTGSVTSGDTSSGLGGLCGWNWGNITSCFWDMQASGVITSDGGEGKNTGEMKTISTFIGWDFAETWGIEDNQTYPFLRLMYPVGDIDLDGDVDFIDFAYFAEHWLEE
jgi:hypothetical protein